MSTTATEEPTGVWLIGARGSVATTAVAGCAAMTAGLHPPTGLVTETPPFARAGLPALSTLVFGGHDTVECPLPKRAEQLAAQGVLPHGLPTAVRAELVAADAEIRTGGPLPGDTRTDEELISAFTSEISDFLHRHGLARAVVINVASTEPTRLAGAPGPAAATGAVGGAGASRAAVRRGPLGVAGSTGSLEPAEATGPTESAEATGATGPAEATGPTGPAEAMGCVGPAEAMGPAGSAEATGHVGSTELPPGPGAPPGRRLPASSLYATAALRAGCPYVNFTPSTGLHHPALAALAESSGLPYAGRDGKTGQTLLRSVLGPMFAQRALAVRAWSGTNLLGGGDGAALADPDAAAAKNAGKERVLADTLGAVPQGEVHIDDVPALGDWKTAWDHIAFDGFLGTRMVLQTTWQGCDSALAAPLILDLARLLSAAHAHGLTGPRPELAFYFKDPDPGAPAALGDQYAALTAFAARLQGRGE
ncbi:inositol-3-phosphate synthase [Streptomyces sp. YIM 121038]|uniref:inositol-3-phosphate synthase n=1 Tax=Streptomyces sp. YIM 121038 TaxID=2136401 RepID=UPI0020177242|nr:inositol-3-phosphate synthase [Streptomyces sp. YIM 121038]